VIEKPPIGEAEPELLFWTGADLEGKLSNFKMCSALSGVAHIVVLDRTERVAFTAARVGDAVWRIGEDETHAFKL
jgi:hypothetical protein